MFPWLDQYMTFLYLPLARTEAHLVQARLARSFPVLSQAVLSFAGYPLPDDDPRDVLPRVDLHSREWQCAATLRYLRVELYNSEVRDSNEEDGNDEDESMPLGRHNRNIYLTVESMPALAHLSVCAVPVHTDACPKLTFLVAESWTGTAAAVKHLVLVRQHTPMLDLRACANLAELDLQESTVSTIACTAPVSMSCSFGQLIRMPCVMDASRLVLLDVGFNRLTSLPPLTGFTALEHLSVSMNELEALPSLAHCIRLKALVMRRTGISSLPPDAFMHLTSLEYLCCSDNPLHALPSLAMCTALRRLDCAHAFLEAIDVSRCRQLVELHCARNCLVGTLDVSMCPALRSVHCRNNARLDAIHLHAVAKVRVKADRHVHGSRVSS